MENTEQADDALDAHIAATIESIANEPDDEKMRQDLDTLLRTIGTSLRRYTQTTTKAEDGRRINTFPIWHIARIFAKHPKLCALVNHIYLRNRILETCFNPAISSKYRRVIAEENAQGMQQFLDALGISYLSEPFFPEEKESVLSIELERLRQELLSCLLLPHLHRTSAFGDPAEIKVRRRVSDIMSEGLGI